MAQSDFVHALELVLSVVVLHERLEGLKIATARVTNGMKRHGRLAYPNDAAHGVPAVPGGQVTRHTINVVRALEAVPVQVNGRCAAIKSGVELALRLV